MTPPGWAVLAAGVLALAAFAALRWHELLAIGLACLTMVVAAIVMSLGNARFTAQLTVSDRRITIGDTVTVSVIVNNPGTTPTTSARGDLPIGNAHVGVSIPMLPPHRSRHTDVQFMGVTRDLLRIGPITVHTGDPFGLVRRERTLPSGTTICIHPDTVRLKTLNAGVARDLDGRPGGQIVDDDLEFYGLREYRPGDDLRNVHWLNTARTGTLMIRQYEATRRTDTSITLDVSPSSYASREEFEMAVSIHASIGVQCLLQNRPLATHAGAVHATARSATDFLDTCSAIDTDQSDTLNIAEDTLRHSSEASFYLFTIGSLNSLNQLRRSMMTLPQLATCLVLRAAAGEPRAIRTCGGFALATVGSLDDLPHVMGALA